MAPAVSASPAAVAASPLARAFTGGGALVFVIALAVGTWRFIALGTPPADGPLLTGLLANTLLFGLFALHHSVLAREPVKAAVARLVSPTLERTTYVWIASLLFIVACLAWRPIAGVFYRDSAALGLADRRAAARRRPADARRGAAHRRAGPGRAAARAGPRPATSWLAAPTGSSVTRSTSAGSCWSGPRSDMTMGRLVFAVISTTYLVIAVPFEERSLRRRFGPSYDAYRRQVRWRIVPGLY